MNHSSSGLLPASKAIVGFSNYKMAQGLAERSVDSYRRDLEQWAIHVGEVDVSRVTRQDIEAYLFYLRTEYVPHRFGGEQRPLSPKTLRNIYVTLAAFFGWVSREFQVVAFEETKKIYAPGSLFRYKRGCLAPDAGSL